MRKKNYLTKDEIDNKILTLEKRFSRVTSYINTLKLRVIQLEYDIKEKLKGG